MKGLNKNKLGFTFGIFFAFLHALWVILVGMGAGQKIIDWVMNLHFMNMKVSITDFSFGNAVLFVVLTFVGGYIIGWIFAAIWNLVSKR